jgi:serine/threonine-protein kinase
LYATNEIMLRCPGCLRPLEGSAVCPSCGTPVQFIQPAPFLPLRALLAQGRFGIGCAAEQNGDGITYFAFDEQTHKPVHVREFFPAAIAVREQGQLVQSVMQGCEAVWQDCAQNFMELWRKLQRMRGLSALLSVTDVFEENGTIYAVYEYMESMTFRDFLLRGKLGYISWERARSLLMPVLSTLGNLHQQGIIHRGISPNTLFFGADGKVRIGGFSIWQARTAHGDLNADLAMGFAALEQYGLEGKQGAWTDIYAFAAVLYRSLIGSDPDDAVTRRHNDRVMVPAQFAERIPAYVINALINAMQVFPEERTRTVEQFRAELSASPAAVARSAMLPQPQPKRPPVAPAPPQKRKKPLSPGLVFLRTAGFIIGGGVALVLLVTGIFFRSQLRDTFAALGRQNVTTPIVSEIVKVSVPLVVGSDFSEELKTELERNFVLIVTTRSDETAPEGRVLRQNLQEGAEVPQYSELVLELSGGKPNIELPKDLTGQEIEAVRAQLEELGFVVVLNVIKNDGAHAANTVAKVVQPKPGEYPRGTKVFLNVWGEGETTATAEEWSSVE